MERSLSISIRMADGEITIGVHEPESGEYKELGFPFSPDEHPEFDAAIGNEIYSWLDCWADMEDKAA